MNQYIITKKGMIELDEYFSGHKDDLIRIAWKNLKDNEICLYKNEWNKNLADELEELANNLYFDSESDKRKILSVGNKLRRGE